MASFLDLPSEMVLAILNFLPKIDYRWVKTIDRRLYRCIVQRTRTPTTYQKVKQACREGDFTALLTLPFDLRKDVEVMRSLVFMFCRCGSLVSLQLFLE